MRISFCITCMNRLYQLQKTLPANLADTAGLSDVEFCLLNYNSQDGLDAWVQQTFPAHIARGQLRYGREAGARVFHGPKAKNLAHLLATGDVLFNLDADNYLAGAVPLVRRFFAAAPSTVLHHWTGTWHDGTFGRIVLGRDAFLHLGGYDEEMLGYGFHDQDLILRAAQMGLPAVRVAAPVGAAIRHSKEDTARHTGITLSREEVERQNRLRSKQNLAAGRFRVNSGGWGLASVRVNFGPPTVLQKMLAISSRGGRRGNAANATNTSET